MMREFLMFTIGCASGYVFYYIFTNYIKDDKDD